MKKRRNNYLTGVLLSIKKWFPLLRGDLRQVGITSQHRWRLIDIKKKKEKKGLDDERRQEKIKSKIRENGIVEGAGGGGGGATVPACQEEQWKSWSCEEEWQPLRLKGKAKKNPSGL